MDEIPLSQRRIEEAQEIYQEIQEMDNQLKIWEMVLEYLASADFIFVILSVFVGVALVKGVNVFDKWLNNSEDK